MWNQTPLLQQRASSLPDRSGDGLRAAIRDVIGDEPVYIHVHRPDVVAQAVSFWRAVQTRMWRRRPHAEHDVRATYHAGAIAHAVAMLREQNDCWRGWFADEAIEPIDVPYPTLLGEVTAVVATVLEAIGQDPRPAPALAAQTDERSDEWVERYRDDARRLGLPE
jgi:LPS sulfotransferase NodH